jgi:hypothetical protein
MVTSLQRSFIGLAVAALALALAGAPADAQTQTKAKAVKAKAVKKPASKAVSYDGLWTVLIMTHDGPCDRTYRYPVRISRGHVQHAGGEGFFSISGRVGPGGGVSVTVQRDGNQAHGTGRLVGNGGGGSWTAGGGICSGQWSASRRG